MASASTQKKSRAKRLGRQLPTSSVVLRYTKSLGQAAIECYNSTGRVAQKWQALLLRDIMAVNKEGLWTHTKFGYSVPRRNGKNEIIAMRELWGLQKGEHILHSAHRVTTSAAAWERLCSLLDKAKIGYKAIRATGRESIRLKDCDGRIEFRTRSSKGGLGEGFDLLVIDEAQEYADDQESALKYVVTDSKNPQTILCGTPPTPVSSGAVFLKLRNGVLQGGMKNTGWAEWGVETQTDSHDIDAWYETNPSLGTIFTERSVTDEIGTDPIDFNIQRLGLWLRYNQKSAITRTEWDTLQCNTLPKLCGKLYIGVKYGHDSTSVALSIAVKTEDGRIFVEAIDCRQARAGNAWLVDFLKCADTAGVVVDGANGQQLLTNEMKKARIKPPLLPTVKQIIVANAEFEQGIFAKHLCHMGQPSLARTASNCEKRAIGANGGFGYKSIEADAKIELLDSVILAYWLCTNAKERRKQAISY